ncbi:hypothetical protein KC345_g11656, partial [Hortaea werneckii]
MLNIRKDLSTDRFDKIVSSINVLRVQMKRRNLQHGLGCKNSAVQHNPRPLHWYDIQMSEQYFTVKRQPEQAAIPVFGPFDITNRNEDSANLIPYGTCHR